MKYPPLPWQVTKVSEERGHEITDAKNNTIAKLTALDLDNAEVIVSAVNNSLRGIRQVTDIGEIQAYRLYLLADHSYGGAFSLEVCKIDKVNGKKYFGRYVWAEIDSPFAMNRYTIFKLPVITKYEADVDEE